MKRADAFEILVEVGAYDDKRIYEEISKVTVIRVIISKIRGGISAGELPLYAPVAHPGGP